jgi:hypothetical protein
MSFEWKCPECGLDYGTISPKDAIQALRSYPRRYRAVLKGFVEDDDDDPDAVIRRRPDPKTWSALEYAAHVADVFDDMDSVFRRMLVEDDPRIPDSWDPDQRATEQRYNEQDAKAVLDRLQANAERAAATLEGVSPDDWKRTAQFDFGRRDLLDMARNAVHEGYHHLRDVERVLRAVVGKPISFDEDDEGDD